MAADEGCVVWDGEYYSPSTAAEAREWYGADDREDVQVAALPVGRSDEELESTDPESQDTARGIVVQDGEISSALALGRLCQPGRHAPVGEGICPVV